MAVPKRKTTRAKRDKRRTHDGIKKVNIVRCPRCHSVKIAHRVCQECGYYNNQEIITKEEKGKAKERAREDQKSNKPGKETEKESKKAS